MRNVRSALLVAAVGLMGLTACSFSSSRSWGSGNGSTANPNAIHGTGKPAQRSSGKPAHQVVDNSKPAAKTPAPSPAPVSKPTPAPAPAEPTRVGRTDEPNTASIGVANSTISAKPTEPKPEPKPSGTIGVASTSPAENPGGIKAAPVKPSAPVNKAAK